MKDTVFNNNGYEHITDAISSAIGSGVRSVTITGNWEISSAIRLPSDFTLILDGCHLKMADGVYSNIFVNEHHDTEIGRTTKGTDKNIVILGKNGAILDGGKYNGLSEKNHSRDGLPPIWKNNLILFTNVDGFEISNIACHNQRWWALNFIYCGNGKLHDIDFKACDIWIDGDGVEHHGLNRRFYSGILIKNADGIDLRQGCNNITIENITGFTEDDSIALTALNGVLEQTFAVEGLPSDLCNVSIKNIKTAAFCTNVRLLNQGDIKLHDIEIDGVFDDAADCPCLNKGLYTVRIGDTHLYGPRHCTADETYNISIKNVTSRATTAAIGLAGQMKNVTFDNVKCFYGTIELEDKRGI